MNDPITGMESEADDERVIVVRIKLRRAERSAVVTDLRTADQMLARWAACDGARRAISFELTFEDGSSVRGSYEGGAARTARLSLSRFVRQTFKEVKGMPQAYFDGLRFTMTPACDAACDAIEAP